MGFMERFRKLDLYREIPKDMTEATTTGGLLSLFCICTVLYLFISELLIFLTPELSSFHFIDSVKDTGDFHPKFTINMNITLHKLPCKIVSVDVQDIMGAHVMDIGGELHKVRLTMAGDEVDTHKEKHELNVPHTHGHDNHDASHDKKSFNGVDESLREQIGEGCRLEGHMQVASVPGNFHISAHAHPELIHFFFGEVPMNVSHTIHHLWFGEKQEDFDAFAAMKENFPHGQKAVLNPLQGAYKSAKLDENDTAGETSKSYEYYIEIVPTEYKTVRNRIHSAYQFVANSNEVAGRYRIPAVYFRYEISAITVRFVETSRSFAHFLVQLCAIIGGVFTVLGLVNTVMNSAVKKLLVKEGQGKLG
jgi:hypothetical protein